MSKAKKIFFLLVIFVPLFIFLEILARILCPQEPFPTVPSKDFNLIYELNPLYPQINSMGMRDREFDVSTLHDHFVIAVIGDSHTYSVGSLSREETFPARLAYHLKARTGRTIRVLNFGVPGYDMAQELEVLRAKALKFKPDLIILQYCINDEHISNFIQPKYIWLNRAIHHSVFLTRLWTRFLYSTFGQKYILSYVEKYTPDLLLSTPGLVGTPRAHEEDPRHAPHPPRSKDQVPARYHAFIGRENLERNVRIFGEICRKEHIPTIATGFIEDQDKPLYEESGFQIYSFFDIFTGVDMQDYGYDSATTDDHFSERGSDFIGKALADYITANFSLSRK